MTELRVECADNRVHRLAGAWRRCGTRVNAARPDVIEDCRIRGITEELHLIEQIEELHTELRVDLLRQLEVLVYREVSIRNSWSEAVTLWCVAKCTQLDSVHAPPIRVQPLVRQYRITGTTGLARYDVRANIVLIGSATGEAARRAFGISTGVDGQRGAGRITKDSSQLPVAEHVANERILAPQRRGVVHDVASEVVGPVNVRWAVIQTGVVGIQQQTGLVDVAAVGDIGVSQRFGPGVCELSFDRTLTVRVRNSAWRAW